MRIPLRLKLALFTGLLLVGGIGIVSVIYQQRMGEALTEEAQKRGRSIAKNLAADARERVLLEDDLTLESLVKSSATEEDVRAARIVDGDGNVVTSSEEDPPPRVARLTRHDAHSSRVQGGRLIAASQMTYQEVDLGEAQVVLDLDTFITRVAARAQRQILLAGGGLLGLALLIAFAMSNRLTRPIARLTEATQALADGDLDARVGETKRRDEIGVLSVAFNEMGERLSQKERIEHAFKQYVSDHVLKQVMEKGAQISTVGEARVITIMFVDVRSFTSISEELNPEGIVAFLNESFDVISKCLLENGATIDKYTGDAVMAYFGAPIPNDDHPFQAVAAAIAVQQAVAERNRVASAAGLNFVKLGVGIAIHSGEVVVGNIGSELKMDYTAIGDPVNVCARLEKLAGERVILVTQAVADCVRDRAELLPQGTRRLEGREQPVTVYSVNYQRKALRPS